VATARNGDVELHYETFGDPSDPTLLLINGLGSQCLNFDPDWCGLYVAESYQVVRFDNRDVGLSSKLDDRQYSLSDMAADAVAVLDALGVEQAHIMGTSMGGAIAQRVAIEHPGRVLTLTSCMSSTGEPDHGQSTPEALAVLMAPPAANRDEYVERHLAAQYVYGSDPSWLDDDDIRRRAGAAYDRCFCPAGVGRQLMATIHDPSRVDALRALDVPTLVIHGSRDTLITPSGGRRTAELIPGARYEEIEGMGHDYPRRVWPTWVGLWTELAATA
jgi:pimeloyl-ACP methyl ester carboxylesterase